MKIKFLQNGFKKSNFELWFTLKTSAQPEIVLGKQNRQLEINHNEDTKLPANEEFIEILLFS